MSRDTSLIPRPSLQLFIACHFLGRGGGGGEGGEPGEEAIAYYCCQLFVGSLGMRPKEYLLSIDHFLPALIFFKIWPKYYTDAAEVIFQV